MFILELSVLSIDVFLKPFVLSRCVFLNSLYYLVVYFKTLCLEPFCRDPQKKYCQDLLTLIKPKLSNRINTPNSLIYIIFMYVKMPLYQSRYNSLYS